MEKKWLREPLFFQKGCPVLPCRRRYPWPNTRSRNAYQHQQFRAFRPFRGFRGPNLRRV